MLNQVVDLGQDGIPKVQGEGVYIQFESVVACLEDGRKGIREVELEVQRCEK